MLAERLLAPLRDAGVDTLLLGCTHYPYLARTIGDVMGRDVVLVSSADETAFSVAAELVELGLAARPPGEAPQLGSSRRATSTVRQLGRQLLGPELDSAESVVGLSLTVLGCSGSYPRRGLQRLPGAGRGVGGRSTGPGSLANLQRHLGLDDIDAVVISHCHPDHWTDLPASTSLQVRPRSPGDAVYGTAETQAGRGAHHRAGTHLRLARRHRRLRVHHRWAALPVRGHRPLRADAGGAGRRPVPARAWPTRPTPGRRGRSTLGPGIDLALCEATNLTDGEGDEGCT